jgi:hypothetical protein
VGAILDAAGFADADFEALEGALSVGGAPTPESAAAFLLEVGPASRALREAGAGPDVRREVAEATAEALRPFADDSGVRMPFSAWIVTARAPR